MCGSRKRLGYVMNYFKWQCVLKVPFGSFVVFIQFAGSLDEFGPILLFIPYPQ